MKRAALALLIVVLAACSSEGYDAHPVTRDGQRLDTEGIENPTEADCFEVEYWDDNSWSYNSDELPGVFCKEEG